MKGPTLFGLFLKKGMNNWSIALIFLWIVLAITNIVGIWITLPVLNATFGVLNLSIIISLIPLLKEEFRMRKQARKIKKENKNKNEL